MNCVPIGMLPTQCPLLPTPWAGEIHWSLLHFGIFIHGFALLQRLHAWTSVTSYTSVNIYNFNSRLAHLYALWMEYIRSLRNWNHGGISCDVHFEGHLRSNRTNIWSDKSNIRNMQSGGARGLELRTAVLIQWLKKIINYVCVVLMKKINWSWLDIKQNNMSEYIHNKK